MQSQFLSGNTNSGNSQLSRAVQQVLKNGINTDINMKGQYKITNYPNTSGQDELINRNQIEALIGTSTSKTLQEINLANPLQSDLNLTTTGNPQNHKLLVNTATDNAQVVNLGQMNQQLALKVNTSTPIDQLTIATDDLNLNNKKIINLADPVDNQDAVTLNFLESNYTTTTDTTQNLIDNYYNKTQIDLQQQTQDTAIASKYPNTTTLNNIALATADVNLNNQKIINLSNPTDDQDAMTKKYADDNYRAQTDTLQNILQDNPDDLFFTTLGSLYVSDININNPLANELQATNLKAVRQAKGDALLAVTTLGTTSDERYIWNAGVSGTQSSNGNLNMGRADLIKYKLYGLSDVDLNSTQFDQETAPLPSLQLKTTFALKSELPAPVDLSNYYTKTETDLFTLNKWQPPTTDVSFNNQKAILVGDPINNQDAVNLQYLTTNHYTKTQTTDLRLDQFAKINTDLIINDDLLLTQHTLKNLPDPIDNQDVATKKYVDDNAGGGGSGDQIINSINADSKLVANQTELTNGLTQLNMNGQKITGLATATDPSDAVRFDQLTITGELNEYVQLSTFQNGSMSLPTDNSVFTNIHYNNVIQSTQSKLQYLNNGIIRILESGTYRVTIYHGFILSGAVDSRIASIININGQEAHLYFQNRDGISYIRNAFRNIQYGQNHSSGGTSDQFNIYLQFNQNETYPIDLQLKKIESTLSGTNVYTRTVFRVEFIPQNYTVQAITNDSRSLATLSIANPNLSSVDMNTQRIINCQDPLASNTQDVATANWVNNNYQQTIDNLDILAQQAPPTGSLNMNLQKITNMAPATLPQDAVNLQQVQNNFMDRADNLNIIANRNLTQANVNMNSNHLVGLSDVQIQNFITQERYAVNFRSMLDYTQQTYRPLNSTLAEISNTTQNDGDLDINSHRIGNVLPAQSPNQVIIFQQATNWRRYREIAVFKSIQVLTANNQRLTSFTEVHNTFQNSSLVIQQPNDFIQIFQGGLYRFSMYNKIFYSGGNHARYKFQVYDGTTNLPVTGGVFTGETYTISANVATNRLLETPNANASFIIDLGTDLQAINRTFYIQLTDIDEAGNITGNLFTWTIEKLNRTYQDWIQ